MQSLTLGIGNYRGRLAEFCLRGLLLAVLTTFGVMLGDRPAAACNVSGKAMYNCMASKLEYKADVLLRTKGDPEAPTAARALQTAASQLRAATNKAQALSAVTQARSAISAVIQQAKAGGRDSQGYSAIVNTLSAMASEIQRKG